MQCIGYNQFAKSIFDIKEHRVFVSATCNMRNVQTDQCLLMMLGLKDIIEACLVFGTWNMEWNGRNGRGAF